MPNEGALDTDDGHTEYRQLGIAGRSVRAVVVIHRALSEDGVVARFGPAFVAVVGRLYDFIFQAGALRPKTFSALLDIRHVLLRDLGRVQKSCTSLFIRQPTNTSRILPRGYSLTLASSASLFSFGRLCSYVGLNTVKKKHPARFGCKMRQ
jgi:hypothetical protein